MEHIKLWLGALVLVEDLATPVVGIVRLISVCPDRETSGGLCP
jgi:hypothetical protein